MTELDDPLEYAADILLETTQEEIERREEGREPLAGHDPDQRSDAKDEILSNVGSYREFCLMTYERPTKPDPDLEKIIRDDDPNLIRTEPALAPGKRRKWLKRLERKISKLRDLLDDLDWATKVGLERPKEDSEGIVENSGVNVEDMISKLDQMATAAKTAEAKDTPKSQGGPVRKTHPRLLVWLCIETFEMYEKKISTDEGSEFREYVSLVHQLATGEANVPLERAVKDMVKIRRAGEVPDFYGGRY